MDPQALTLRPTVGLTTGHSKAIFGTTISFLILATAFVALRAWAGRLRRKPYRIDDYLVFGALFLYYGQAACTLVQLFLGGAGHHVEELHPKNIELSLQMLIPLAILYSIEMASIKCSICLMLVRIFFIRSFRMAAYMVMTVTILWSIYAAIGTWALCTPIAFNWNPMIPGGHCANRQASFYAIGVLDVATDCLIFLLPIPMIWNLQTAMRNKIGLYLIFSIGVVSIIISGLRAKSTLSISFSDFTYTGALGFIWSQIEPGIGLIIASCLLLRPVLDKVIPHGLNMTAKRSPRHTTDRTAASEHTFPLRDVDTGNTTTTAFAAAGSEPSLEDGVTGPGWKYTMMDDDRAVTPANESIKVETRWDIERHERKSAGV